MRILKIKKATPMGSGVICTCDRYEEQDCLHNGILDTSKLGRVKEFQKIISCGEYALNRGLAVDKFVSINFNRYKKVKNVKRENSLINDTDELNSKESYYELPILLLNDSESLMIDSSDIELVIDDFEYVVEGDIDYAGGGNLVLS